MTEKVAWVPFDVLENYMFDVFKGIGVPEDDARTCADVLITSDKRGIDSHGIGRCKTIYYDRINIGIQHPCTNFEIIRQTPTTAVVDGHDGMGHVIGKKSMQMAIDKAKKYGMGMVAVRNSTHYGIAGYYALIACENDMIGMTGSNARPSVAPTFGVENMMGTNPMTFGIPTDEDFPFVLDCATSLTQRGKIEVCDRAEKELPEGWVIDQHGNTRTDTKKVLEDLVNGTCALTPLGGIGEEGAGYKGYGYCTVVEILCAALQQGAYMKMLTGLGKGGEKIPYKLGHFFMAIDINAFIEPEKFKQMAGEILRELRHSRKMPKTDRIYTAGEKEHLAWLNRQYKGAPINENLQKEILTMSKELGLNQYDFSQYGFWAKI